MHWVGGLLVGMVAVSSVTWLVAAHVMRSPAELAAQSDAPEPVPVSVPVEKRLLESELVVRGTVRFDEPVSISLAGTPAVDGRMVTTWLPEPDDTIDEGDVIAEVSGRPVIALVGPIPAYRDLRPGITGDDVAQLQQALRRLGHLDGEVDGAFGPNTGIALAALYEAAGHEAARPSADNEELLRSAEQRLTNASVQVDQAERRLAEARQGPSDVQVLEAQQQVVAAREQVEVTDEGTAERRRALDELALAEARLAELHAPADTAVEQAEVDAARKEHAKATTALREAEAASGPWLPAGEVVYVAELPQRVDTVSIDVGAEAGGELLTISSTDIVIETSIPAQDADLASEGDRVLIDADGGEVEGLLAELADRTGTHDVDDDRHYARVDPREEAADLLDQSLRIRIPVESTDGQVLAVPLAAVSVAADGSSRVEVVDTDNPTAGDYAGIATRLVTVEPGLSADGMVEVTPVDGDLAPDDLVVIGNATGEPEVEEDDA